MSLKRTLANLLSLGLALVLVLYLVRASGLNLEELWLLLDARVLAGASVLMGCGFVLASYRWYLLLRHIGVHLRFLVVFRLSLIGLFFNLLVPGGVGGDLIKIVYLRKEARERFAKALLTVLLDRLFGLAGLLILTVGVLAHKGVLGGAWDSPEVNALLGFVFAVTAVALLLLLLFFLWPMLVRWGLTGPASNLSERLPRRLVAALQQVGEALALVRSSPGKLLSLTGLSMGIHLCATSGVLILGRGLGLGSTITFTDYLLATQLGNLVAAIPATPGGVGGRDLTMALILRLCGAPPDISAAVPLLLTSLLIGWGLVGGLALLWERSEGLKDLSGDEERG